MDTDQILEYIENNVSVDAIGAISIFFTVASLFLWKYFVGKDEVKQRKGLKKPSFDKKPVALDPAAKIEHIYLRYENEFKDRIEKINEIFDSNDEKDVYERNYCNEMLLKLLIELDGVDLLNIEGDQRKALRQRRKDIIKIIQDELVKLDSLK